MSAVPRVYFQILAGKLGWIVSCRLDRETMIYFYRRAGDTRTCETRLEPDGTGFELVVVDGHDSRVERFEDVTSLTSREHELRYAWLSHGWRPLGPDDDEIDEEE